MALVASRFKPEEEVSIAGKLMRVAGLVQFQAPGPLHFTRYLLAAPQGTSQILEERGDKFALLRPFPAAAQPQAEGSSVSVMGEKYKLSGVRRLTLLGTAGEVPQGMSSFPLILSGLFEGAMGALVRDIAPGANTQQFYSLKPVASAELLGAAEIAVQQEAARLVAEQQAEADAQDSADGPGGKVKTAIGWVVSILVIVGLAYACSGSDDEYSGGARSVTYHGGGSHHSGK